MSDDFVCVPHDQCDSCSGNGLIMKDAGPGAGAYDMVGDCPRQHYKEGVYIPRAVKLERDLAAAHVELEQARRDRDDAISLLQKLAEALERIGWKP